MKTLLGLFPFLVAANVRNNGRNCFGVRSCRPRCLSFRLDWAAECDTASGVFAMTSDDKNTAWDLSRSYVGYCAKSQMPVGGVVIRVTESSPDFWSFTFEFVLARADETFTFCSVYPCPKSECALPEQTASSLTLSAFPANTNLSSQEPLFGATLGLTSGFVGESLLVDGSNRLGLMEMLWMDDPTNCRPGVLSPWAPALPRQDAMVTSVFMDFPVNTAADIFCLGTEYEPAPLPQTAATAAPQAFVQMEQLTLRYWFRSRPTVLDKEELRLWKSLTRSYVRLLGVDLATLSVVGQSIVPVGSDWTVTTVGQRRLQPDNHGLSIEATLQGEDVQKVQPLLEQYWDGYLAFLRRGRLTGFETLTPPPAPTTPNKSTSDLNWKLLGPTLGLSLLALVISLAMRRAGRRAVGSAPTIPEDASQAATPTPPIEEDASEVSEESEGGWNTETSLDADLNSSLRSSTDEGSTKELI